MNPGRAPIEPASLSGAAVAAEVQDHDLAATNSRRDALFTPAGTWVLLPTVALVRLAYSWHHRGVYRVPDELSYLGGARWLAGGNWNMLDAATWSPGYSVLLQPVLWFTADPDTVIRLALVANALLGGAAAVLLYYVARRLIEAPQNWLLLASGAISVLPPALVASAHAWPEPAIAVAVLLTQLLLIRAFETGRSADVIGAAVVSVGAYPLHGRLGPLVVSTAVILAIGARRRFSLRAAAGGIAVLAIGTIAAQVAIQSYYAAVWESTGSVNTVGETLSRLGDVKGLAISTVGQLWYLTVSTLGLAALGSWYMLQRLQQRSGRAAGLVVLGTTAPLVALSILFMAGRDQPHYVVYGRYSDAIAMPIVVVGAVWLAKMRHEPLIVWRRLGAVAASALAGALIIESSGVLRPLRTPPTWDNTAGLVPLSLGRNHIDVAVITLVAMSAGGLVGLVLTRAHRRRVAVTIGLAGLVSLGAVSRATVHERALPWYLTDNTRQKIEVVSGGDAILVRIAPGRTDTVRQLASALTVQWYLPEVRFELEHDEATSPRLVLAHIDDPVALRQEAELVVALSELRAALWLVGPTPK